MEEDNKEYRWETGYEKVKTFQWRDMCTWAQRGAFILENRNFGFET